MRLPVSRSSVSETTNFSLFSERNSRILTFQSVRLSNPRFSMRLPNSHFSISGSIWCLVFNIWYFEIRCFDKWEWSFPFWTCERREDLMCVRLSSTSNVEKVLNIEGTAFTLSLHIAAVISAVSEMIYSLLSHNIAIEVVLENFSYDM